MSSTVTVIFLLTTAVPDRAARIFSAMADPLLVGRLSTGVVLFAMALASLGAAGAGPEDAARVCDTPFSGAAAGSEAQALVPSASANARQTAHRAGRREGEAGNELMPPYRPKARAT